ncbi:MAG: ABC transporter ATP-binding protein [Ruminococcus sp.]|nr:ABC transporter ATP-binding protein [Ruminococcus sp.]
MIEIKNVSKSFGKTAALDNLSFCVEEGSVFGLVGSNGAGKSTLLRIIGGVFRAESGEALVDGENSFENTSVKNKLFFVPDYPYFFNNSTVRNLAALYRGIYRNWDEEYFEKLLNIFPIKKNDKIINMSKGMQRQAALILALSTRPKYLLLDEIFDGLDPVVRQLVKRLIITNVTDNGMTAIIASHNLRELEDICDHVGLLHKGEIVLEKELDELKLGIHKVQIAFKGDVDEAFLDEFDVINKNRQGNLFQLTIRGEESELMPRLEALEPAFVEALPLTLEEVFINEMEGVGYEIENILR